MGYQRGLSFALRAAGLFADSWVLHKGEQGIEYPGATGDPLSFSPGCNVSGWHNGTHVKFGVDRGGGMVWGAEVATAQPIPNDAVGCVGACGGGVVALEGCVKDFLAQYM